jgi:dihydroorotase/N-acyl-D-amino-acid deacylase
MRVLVPAFAVLLAVGAVSAADSKARFDLVLAGGRVVDGTGAPWFRADIGIAGDRIAAVGDLRQAEAARRIDAAGLVVAPGFIDMMGQSEYNVLVDSRAALATADRTEAADARSEHLV